MFRIFFIMKAIEIKGFMFQKAYKNAAQCPLDIHRNFLQKSDLLTMVTPLTRVKNRRVKQERYPISTNRKLDNHALFVLNDMRNYDELKIFTSYWRIFINYWDDFSFDILNPPIPNKKSPKIVHIKYTDLHLVVKLLIQNTHTFI